MCLVSGYRNRSVRLMRRAGGVAQFWVESTGLLTIAAASTGPWTGSSDSASVRAVTYVNAEQASKMGIAGAYLPLPGQRLSSPFCLFHAPGTGARRFPSVGGDQRP
jgi:hypothetical protein